MIPTTDRHPATFPIEIDRERLRAYLRTCSLLAWTGSLAIFGAPIGLLFVSKAMDSGDIRSFHDFMVLPVKHAFMGMSIGIFAGMVLYLGLSHWQSALSARHTAASIDGPFLCIQQGAFIRSNRKIHFRSIHDYAVIDHWLSRRFGLQTLRMTTSGGGQYPFITVPGIKDCLRVRDMLAEIDAQRENS